MCSFDIKPNLDELEDAISDIAYSISPDECGSVENGSIDYAKWCSFDIKPNLDDHEDVISHSQFQ